MIKLRLITVLFIGCSIVFAAATADACTAFCLNSDRGAVVGKNFDFLMGNGRVFVNRRGVRKTGIDGPQGQASALGWTSRFGSVTFNWWGREFPFSGMNEAGLVVCALGLRETQFPPPDERPSIFVSQWVQYQLDNYSTLDEVLSSVSRLRIRPPLGTVGKVHYFVCDRAGRCAAVEFLDGRAVCHTGEGLPVRALTNTGYQESLACLESGRVPVPDHIASIARFIQSARMLERYRPGTSGPAADYALAVLRKTALGEVTETDGQEIRSLIATEWSIVYDSGVKRIYFNTFDSRDLRWVDFESLDFSCAAPAKVLDLRRQGSGDAAAQFVSATAQMNRETVAANASVIPRLSDPPAEGLKRISVFPEGLACKQ